MGLDGVELLMALEEGFGVTLTDADAAACVTPAAVIDLVVAKLRTSDEKVCVSQRAFYLLRKGLKETLDVPRKSVALDTDIRNFVAERPHREVWQELKTAVQARSWPALARPTWLVASLAALVVGTCVALLARFHWSVAAICAFLVAVVAARSTRRFRSRIPARYSHVRSLVPFAVTSDTVAWTRDQVAALVKKLVIEQLGLRESQYREDADFVKDYGMD